MIRLVIKHFIKETNINNTHNTEDGNETTQQPKGKEEPGKVGAGRESVRAIYIIVSSFGSGERVVVMPF